MSREVYLEDLGVMPYREAWDYQQSLLERLQRHKLAEEGPLPPAPAGFLLFVEHPHVYTLGKSGDRSNLLIPPEKMQEEQIAFYHTNRGGDITYHGPGQIVGYPILDLDSLGIGIRKYIHLVEETIIRVVGEYGVEAARLEEATGVWVHTGAGERPEKICAIGVRVSRGVTMHGFAFNVNTDLRYFRYINPCGYTDKGVTSLERETGQRRGMEEVKRRVAEKFAEVFEVHVRDKE
jgi:lipoyl(octanoyl) transferase